MKQDLKFITIGSFAYLPLSLGNRGAAIIVIYHQSLDRVEE